MISVLILGFGVPILLFSPDERGPESMAWFCVRLQRLLPRRTDARGDDAMAVQFPRASRPVADDYERLAKRAEERSVILP